MKVKEIRELTELELDSDSRGWWNSLCKLYF